MPPSQSPLHLMMSCDIISLSEAAPSDRTVNQSINDRCIDLLLESNLKKKPFPEETFMFILMKMMMIMSDELYSVGNKK